MKGKVYIFKDNCKMAIFSAPLACAGWFVFQGYHRAHLKATSAANIAS